MCRWHNSQYIMGHAEFHPYQTDSLADIIKRTQESFEPLGGNDNNEKDSSS